MATLSLRPTGDFRTSYRADTTIFPTRLSLWFCIAGVVIVALAPFYADRYWLDLLVRIGYLGIAALGLNILVGFTGQISIGHAAFFGVGAFASAFLTEQGIPVALAIPLAGLWTTAVGLLFGLPAARLKGLYLAIATLAAQFILEDFFARARWFTGGVAGRLTEPLTLFGVRFDSNETYLWIVLAYVVVMYVMAANLMRTRDGRALVAVRDHYLSAELMGINLTRYRVLAFGISAFYAGIGGALYAHYLLFVSVEAFNILFSIEFLGMIIIGGLGSVMGSLMGTAFMVMLPEVVQWIVGALRGGLIDRSLGLAGGIAFLREMAIGATIILFLVFEPDGLAHRWKQIKAYWKLWPFSH
jgi:branched-chain amino acid transport system permease protein